VFVDVQGTSTAVQAPTLDLRWSPAVNTVDATTRAGSLNPDSNYTGLATSTAALNANSGNLENFSSGGPVQLGSTTTCPGGAAGPCTGVAGGGLTSTGGPTWAAADAVQISGAGGFGVACGALTCFNGTSAAAPHAAACDALLRDELNQPGAAPATTNARLAATAVDVDSPGTDNNTGAGRLDCLAAVNDPPVADAGGPYTTDEGTPVVLSATGSSDPDTNDTLTYAWDLDNDGLFDDSTSATPTMTEVGDNGVFTVRVRVTDTAGAQSTDSAAVTVNNVPPTAVIDPTGAVIINGVVTFIGNAGGPFNFAGNSKDPGSDDLVLTWDWGDGPPAPDVSRTSLVNPPLADPFPSPSVQPRDVNDVRSHTFGDACLYQIKFGSADDDGGTGAGTAAVGVAGNATKARSSGNWQHQYRRNGHTDFTDARLLCYLAIVGHVSSVFNETRDASTIAKAHDVLFMTQNGGSRFEKFDRALLTALLNFADGALPYNKVVNGIPFSAALATAEAVRRSAAPTDAQLLQQQKIIERY
jgi:PKD domain/Subtilase family